ncbi:MAG: methanol dehydrogenase [Candidatus Moranbacteria bacterium]|nr:methanol dehydrogenase [Candidatus Moranbacteria bacterium]
MARRTVKVLFLCLFSLFLTFQAFALDAPKLTGYVNDTAGMMSPEQARQLSRDLELDERASSNQIFVLTIPTLAGEDIKQYSVKVFEAWKPGMKGRDNGVLILVAKQERKVRIEVGYGLEGKLTDLTAGRIIREEMAPKLKTGDTFGGLSDGIDKIHLAVNGQYKGDGTSAVDGNTAKSSGKIPGNAIIAIGAIIVAIFVVGIAGAKSYALAGTVSSFLSGMISYTLLGIAAWWALLLIMLISFLLGLLLAAMIQNDLFGSGSGGGYGFDGFSGGDSGGSGGGGFSGGGGDCGGGGADGGF